MRPIDPDEFVDSLDFSDRWRYCHKWGKLLLKGSVERVTDRLLEAAFAALSMQDNVPSTDSDQLAGHCMLGVFRAIRQGITERPGQAERFASRVAPFAQVPILTSLRVPSGSLSHWT